VRVNRLLTAALPVLLAGASTLGVALPSAGAVETQQPAAQTLGVASAQSVDSQFFDLLNGVRGSVGLPAFRYDTSLSAYAIAQAQAMAAAGTIFHSNIGSLLGTWSTVGENVGVGPSVDAVHAALVASPGHYANMTNAGFTTVGIGVAVDGAGRVFTAHVFAA
jgi:uncharacterized protein YkwD